MKNDMDQFLKGEPRRPSVLKRIWPFLALYATIIGMIGGWALIFKIAKGIGIGAVP